MMAKLRSAKRNFFCEWQEKQSDSVLFHALGQSFIDAGGISGSKSFLTGALRTKPTTGGRRILKLS
jgi:hypothetical protein